MKSAITDQFHEYLYGGHFDVYTDNNCLTSILTSAKPDAVGQCWVAALANYNFQLYYKTGKSNVEADALSQIPWHKAKSEYSDLDPVTVKAIKGGCTTEIPLTNIKKDAIKSHQYGHSNLYSTNKQISP